MSFDPRALRAGFPLLAAAGDALHYLDSAATAQIHASALEALLEHETRARANVLRGTYRLAEAADAAYELARERAARFLNAGSADEIVFTGGTTAALNLVAHGVAADLRSGDEILVSAAEHHSNFVPWQRACRASGARLRILPLTGTGRMDLARLDEFLTPRCRLVALAHASNVTGALTDVARVVAAAQRVGARVLLDGAQAAQHGPQDVRALGVDYYALSGHKCYGPTGVGVLWGRREALASLPPFHTGGGMVGRVRHDASTWAAAPRRFEAGTPPIAQAVGLGAAFAWMMDQPWSEIRRHENHLAQRLLDALARCEGLRLIGPADTAERLPIVAFEVAGAHPHDLCQVLDTHGLCLRGGHHCAQPLMDALGIEGCTRASIAPYNDEADIDALLAGLEHALRVLR